MHAIVYELCSLKGSPLGRSLSGSSAALEGQQAAGSDGLGQMLVLLEGAAKRHGFCECGLDSVDGCMCYASGRLVGCTGIGTE